MKGLFILIGILILGAILCALPLYLSVNLVCWVFHLSFRITLLQSFALSLLGNVIHSLLFENSKEVNK